MSLKRRLISLFICALLLFMVGGIAWSAPETVYNWGDVRGDVDVIPLVLYGDTYYAPLEAQSEMEFRVQGGSSPAYFQWYKPLEGDTTFDVLIMRTTSESGDLAGTIWFAGGGDADSIDLYLEKEEDLSGNLSLSFDNTTGLLSDESRDISFSWDFTQADERFVAGTLHAKEFSKSILEGDTASCDVGIVLLEETPTFDIFVGKYDFENTGKEMEHARALGPVTSTGVTVDAGLQFLLPGDSLGIIYANFWDEQIELSDGQEGLSIIRHLFAPDLYGGDGPPAMVQVDDNDSGNDDNIIDPALALVGYLSSIGKRENSFTDINFLDGTRTRISWLWCELIAQDGSNAVGFAGNPTSADFNDELDDKIYKVIVSDDFWPMSVTPEEFNIVTAPSSGDFIGLVSMDISIPFHADVFRKWAIPIGLRIGIPGENIEQYDPDLMQTVEAELGENPTEEELEAAVRKYLSFTKEWSTGETAQIRLDDPEFADAVDIYFEMDGEGDVNNIIFEFTLLIVNGGEPGVVDSATADGRKYIVIYDGDLDLSFSDPIKIVAAYEEDTSGSSESGCSAFGFVPAAGLLLLPLLMLFKK